MALVKFRLKASTVAVWINTDQVVMLRESGKLTEITLSVGDRITVEAGLDDTAAQLTKAAHQPPGLK